MVTEKLVLDADNDCSDVMLQCCVCLSVVCDVMYCG